MTALLRPESILTITGLTLAVWLLVFFWMPDYPLSNDQTTVVAAIWALVVVAGKKVSSLFRRPARST